MGEYSHPQLCKYFRLRKGQLDGIIQTVCSGIKTAGRGKSRLYSEVNFGEIFLTLALGPPRTGFSRIYIREILNGMQRSEIAEVGAKKGRGLVLLVLKEQEARIVKFEDWLETAEESYRRKENLMVVSLDGSPLVEEIEEGEEGDDGEESPGQEI